MDKIQKISSIPIKLAMIIFGLCIVLIFMVEKKSAEYYITIITMFLMFSFILVVSLILHRKRKCEYNEKN